jgi:hypothetical protein
MTYLEGFKQAMREVGQSEEEIEERIKLTLLMMPMPVPPNSDIPAGRERGFMDIIKRFHAEWQERTRQDPDGVMDELVAKVRKRNKRN